MALHWKTDKENTTQTSWLRACIFFLPFPISLDNCAFYLFLYYFIENVDPPVSWGGGVAIDPQGPVHKQSQVNYNELELQFKSISSNFIG